MPIGWPRRGGRHLGRLIGAVGVVCSVCRLGAAATPGAFVTSGPETRYHAWTAPKRSAAAAIQGAFPEGAPVYTFDEARDGITLTPQALESWIEVDLLSGLNGDPFAEHGGRVPIPWHPAALQDGDQLAPGHFVAYSRRQLCFVVAKSLLGASTDGYENGLRRYLETPGHKGCLPRTGDFGRSMVAFLASCAADPGLANGAQGPVIVVAKAAPPPTVDDVRARAAAAPLADAGLRVCRYDDVAEGPLTVPGFEAVPAAGCAPPTSSSPGTDFMTGGLPGQAVQDISAAFFGGYIFGNACGLGGGQDERLMTYMPEVAALAFFLSEDPTRPQLRQPAWVLGARMLFKGLDGTARFNDPPVLDPTAPLAGDLVPWRVGAAEYSVSSSRPFVAFMSENQGFYPGEWGRGTPRARRNRHPLQREVDHSSWFAFEKQVWAWYRSVALDSYHTDVRALLLQQVHSIGTGPWLAGLWFGDSQLGLLAVWLGQAIAAQTWGGPSVLKLDYYIYSAFTENPGNQCFVHSAGNCQACIAHCLENALPDTAFWLPDDAFMGNGSCVPSREDCGQKGLQEVAATYASAGVTARQLWDDVERALGASANSGRRRRHSADSTVFDLLLQGTAAVSNAALFP